MTSRSEVWIGLAHVVFTPKDQRFKGAHGAYVNVLASAPSLHGFRREIQRTTKQTGLKLLSLGDIELLNQRLRKRRLDSGLLKLSEEVKRTHRVCFDVFFTYVKERAAVTKGQLRNSR